MWFKYLRCTASEKYKFRWWQGCISNLSHLVLPVDWLYSPLCECTDTVPNVQRPRPAVDDPFRPLTSVVNCDILHPRSEPLRRPALNWLQICETTRPKVSKQVINPTSPVCGLRWFRWYFMIGLHPLQATVPGICVSRRSVFSCQHLHIPNAHACQTYLYTLV